VIFIGCIVFIQIRDTCGLDAHVPSTFFSAAMPRDCLALEEDAAVSPAVQRAAFDALPKLIFCFSWKLVMSEALVVAALAPVAPCAELLQFT